MTKVGGVASVAGGSQSDCRRHGSQEGWRHWVQKTCVCLFCLEFANANVAPATLGALGPVLAAVDLESDRTLGPELLEYPVLVVGR